jgi:hypothetical protein
MPEVKRLVTRLLFSSLPADWSLCAVSIDWQGEPLILLQEGKPPRPAHDAGIDATIRWLNTPPKRHHLIRWENASVNQLTFENPTGLTITNHVQPFGDGWLIAEGRGGLARVFDKQKNLVRTVDLGDAIEHINTTPDGHIWVGYFDEGVFGRGIGREGLICFDSAGTPVFRYADFAKKHNLPFIDDCYTLNVVGSSAYVSYYTDFPLVCLTDFQLRRVWDDFGPNKAIAIRSDHFVVFPVYHKPYLTVRSFDSPDLIVWELVTSEGRQLSKLAGGPPETTTTGWYVSFQCVARDNRLYVYDDIGVYELP